MKKDLILVFGARGTVGSEVVRLLKAEGHSVRVASSKASESPDTVKVDLASGAGLKEAFEGVDRAFLMVPPGYADQYKIASPMIAEAKRRNLKKVVLMTAMGVNASDEIPFRRAEIELEKSGLNYNIVRPNWFLQNFNTFWIQGIREQGKILLPAGAAKTSFIDARDISAVIAKLLTSDQHNNKAFDITGPESLDHDQVAKEISAASGKTVRYQEIEPKVLKQGLLGAGLPDDYADFLLTILSYLKAGYNAATTNSVKEILGRDPLTIKNYAKTYKNAWS